MSSFQRETKLAGWLARGGLINGACGNDSQNLVRPVITRSCPKPSLPGLTGRAR